MEIEPEVIPPQGRRQNPWPPNRPRWQTLLAGVAGLAVFVLILWLAFWVALVLIGLALIGWVVRKIVMFFTGTTGTSDSSVKVTIYRGPR
jgi:hypothetical protein